MSPTAKSRRTPESLLAPKLDRVRLDRDAFLEAFSAAAQAAPGRTPKPALECILLIAGPDGPATLTGTNQETGVVATVLGVEAERPVRALLPIQRVGSILRTTRDAQLDLEVTRADDGDRGKPDPDRWGMTLRGASSQFSLAAPPPDQFPDVVEFGQDDQPHHSLSAADLARAVGRVGFCCDDESTRYALGGALFEFGEDTLTVVATDGRRLARQVVPAESVLGGAPWKGSPVVPRKALRLIERAVEPREDGPVAVRFLLAPDGIPRAVVVRTARMTVWARLLEGRFPMYGQAIPDRGPTRAFIRAGELAQAIAQANVATSEECRGVRFRFDEGRVVLEAAAPDVGSARVDLAMEITGPGCSPTLDGKYVDDFLRRLDAELELEVSLAGDMVAVRFDAQDGLTHVVMPLLKES